MLVSDSIYLPAIETYEEKHLSVLTVSGV